MRLRNKILGLSLSVIAATAIYGNIRFHLNTYEPQCEHSPNFCIYGTSSKISRKSQISTTDENGTEKVRSYDIYIHRNEDITYLKPEYFFSYGTPILYKVLGSEGNCNLPHPTQAVEIPLERALIRGCLQSPWELNAYLASYMGIKEIFTDLYPLPVIDDNVYPRFVELKNSKPVFWKGLDKIFGIGLFFLTYFSFIGKKPLIWFRKVKEYMEDKKEIRREKLKKEFLGKLEELRQRTIKAKTIEECRKINSELEYLSDELIKKDKKVFDEVSKNYSKLSDLLDGQVEYLGGPKAPFHIGTKSE